MKPGPCIDAETLAAWADGRLTPAERDAVEAHAADCERCQAVVAAMVRAEPPAGDAAEAWWRRPLFGWLVPLGTVTAAAAAIIWFVVMPGMTRAPQQSAPMDTIAEAPPPAPAPQSSVKALTVKKEAAKETAPREDRLRDKDAALDEEKAAANKNEPAAPEAKTADAAPAAQAAPMMFASRQAAGNVRRDETVRLAGQAPFPEIVSSNPSSRWRVTASPGLIQHSADGGSTWDMQQTNVTTELMAGSSPQPSVCWLVGRNGVVLLSTDARTWRRVPFPETVDVTAVQATDESTATVTTADGRKLVTADAGATWDRAPVQEIPAAPF